MRNKRSSNNSDLAQTTPAIQRPVRASTNLSTMGTKRPGPQKPLPPGVPYMNREMRRRMAQMQAVKRTVGEEKPPPPPKPSLMQRTVQFARQNAIWIITFVVLVAIAIALSIHK